MDFALADIDADIAAVAATFVDREVVPHMREWDRTEAVDRAIVARMGELGILGLGIDEAHGGTPASFQAYAAVMEELGRGDNSVRGIVSVSLGLVGKSIQSFGTPEQKDQWLPAITSGQALGCFGLTEPDSGSDPASMRSTARRDGSDYVLNGEKMFITNGTWAAVALVFARTDDGRISAFLVPTDTPGFTATEITGKLGLRGQATAALSLSDVRVPESARLGDEGRGMAIALSALTKGRISVAASSVGVAQAALDFALGYAKERVQFGTPIAAKQLVQELLADSAVEIDAARLLTQRAAWGVDQGTPLKNLSLPVSMAKLAASEAAVSVTNRCLQVLGGYGFVDEFPLGKYVRDARVLTLYEGTSQIQKLIIGRELTGHNAM